MPYRALVLLSSDLESNASDSVFFGRLMRRFDCHVSFCRQNAASLAEALRTERPDVLIVCQDTAETDLLALVSLLPRSDRLLLCAVLDGDGAFLRTQLMRRGVYCLMRAEAYLLPDMTAEEILFQLDQKRGCADRR